MAISAGVDHALGLLDNGQVSGFGRNHDEQCSGATAALEASGGSRYLSIAAGNDISMGLTDSGTIVFWGSRMHIDERVVWPPAGRRFVW